MDLDGVQILLHLSSGGLAGDATVASYLEPRGSDAPPDAVYRAPSLDDAV